MELYIQIIEVTVFSRSGWDTDEVVNNEMITAKTLDELTQKVNMFIANNTYRHKGDFGITLGSSDCKKGKISVKSYEDFINDHVCK